MEDARFFLFTLLRYYMLFYVILLTVIPNKSEKLRN